MKNDNTFLSVNENSWKKLLTGSQRELTKECDFGNELFVKELKSLTSEVILSVRNGLEKDPKIINRVQKAGFINQTYEYSVNLGKFAGELFRQKIGDNPDCAGRLFEKLYSGSCYDYVTKSLSVGAYVLDGREDFDVYFTDERFIYSSNESYERNTIKYSVNAKAIEKAERLMRQIIQDDCFDVVKKIYLHPGPMVEPTEEEERVIRKAQKRLKEADFTKILRLYYVSDKRIHERYIAMMRIMQENAFMDIMGINNHIEMISEMPETDSFRERMSACREMSEKVLSSAPSIIDKARWFLKCYERFTQIADREIYADLRDSVFH